MSDQRERDSAAEAGETAGLWRWIVVPSMIFSILAAIVVCLYFGYGIYVKRKLLAGMSPDEIKEYEEWISKKLTFDPADLEAPPFSDATVRAAKDFFLKWEDLKTTAGLVVKHRENLEQSEALTSDTATWIAFGKELASLQPLIGSFSNVVNQPDYEIFAFAVGKNPAESEHGLPLPNFPSLQVTAKLLKFQAEVLAREGRFPEAFERAELITRSTKTQKFSTLIEKLVAIVVSQVGTQAWFESVEQCDNPILLRETLERQNALAPKVEFVPRDVATGVLDDMGMILAAKRLGIIEEPQGLTAWQIMQLAGSVQARFLREIVCPSLAHDPARLADVWKRAEFETMNWGLVVKLPMHPLPPPPGFSALFYTIAFPNRNALETYARDDVARTRFDLLRLYTAAKLFRLEHGSEAKPSESDLVPAYLPEMPKDLFAKDDRTLSLTPVPYSIGPDGADQGAALLYDPTNGTTSAGDLFFQ